MVDEAFCEQGNDLKTNAPPACRSDRSDHPVRPHVEGPVGAQLEDDFDDYSDLSAALKSLITELVSKYRDLVQYMPAY